jgi:hypothetical protein
MRAARLLFLGLLAGTLGCQEAMVRASKEPASWAYVSGSTTGIKLAPVGVSGGYAVLSFTLWSNRDSAVCFYDPSARVEGHRILLGVKKAICSDGPVTPLVARVPDPGSGEYELAFDDASAGYPTIARIVVGPGGTSLR